MKAGSDGVPAVGSGSSRRERARELSLDGGTLPVARAYSICASCRPPSYPLAAQ
jgi:hypothetical protein